ncbi:MAG TPA: phenylalanine--tRNA ligase subunit beta [Candidatus Limnocylindrales bacterium]|jgi:phenylalanyl-tRNA synthetase beta chain|nr:phenylalanine--tRNA ligase subunit beta [Candidatus Limnocylindrales bacterium]
MRVPLAWLRDYVDVDLTPEELAERLTLLGMEVQRIERWGEDWRNVVVGELLTVEPHPRADRLSLTTVTTGSGEPLSIVCGATNIAPGQRVPVALPGAVLPGGRRIDRTEKMGVVSNGMLCSGEELGLTNDAEGILILPGDAKLGRPLAELYGDAILDVDVKPNRGDALSLVGLSREVAAATGASLHWPETDPDEGRQPVDELLAVEVKDPDLAPRFVGRWVSGVRVGPSPDAVQMRLLAAGMRPVSNVVDATNYVMLELGKPIHAFDAAAIVRDRDGRARIVVRRAKKGERLETLDHVDRTLDPETLLIADTKGPLGIAGIMGGATSEVGDGTKDVVVESAIFDPVSIRRTGQRYGLRSEASLRFEKGQEVPLARVGADRTARLIREWAGGTVARGRVDSAPVEPPNRVVAFRPQRVNRLLGTSLRIDEQRELLARVGVGTEAAPPGELVTVALEPKPVRVEPAAGEAVSALVPSWRRDIAIEADVAEEIARVHGYERVPGILPHTPTPPWRASPLEVRDAVRETLVGAGLTEVVTYALVSPGHAETFRLRTVVPSVDDEPEPAGEPVAVTNPLSRDHSVLRPGLIGSLLDVVAANLRHGRDAVAAFEVGKGYGRRGDRPSEWWRLGFALTGPAEPPAWNRPARPFDVDDAKGIVELLARRLGTAEASWAREAGEPLFHPGRTARVSAGDRLAGIVGELHPEVLAASEVRTDRVVVAELSVAGLGAGRLPTVRSVPPDRFPAIERDLAVVVAEDRPAAEVAASIRAHGGELLRSVTLFDVYRGAPLAADEKSLAHRLTFQAADRTLTEAEVDAVSATIAAGLERDLGARLRT